MATLERITTEYVEDEDRIRLSGEVPGGPPVVIWLTRRLLDRLVPLMLDRIGRVSNDPAHAELLNSFAQQAARETLTPQPPVDANAADTHWLARQIDIGQSDEAWVLTFKDGGAAEATLTLGTTQARQWLQIVQTAYAKADWGSALWPDWLTEPAGETAVPPLMLN